MKIYTYWVLAIGIGAILFPALAQTCPFCFSSATEEVLHTYYLSVIFMSLLPFGVVGGLAIWIYKNKRSVSGSQVEESSQDRNISD
ncbi:MAG: hypothetical protein V3U54_06265 [Thermodesulfobacteriota bacterium]